MYRGLLMGPKVCFLSISSGFHLCALLSVFTKFFIVISYYICGSLFFKNVVIAFNPTFFSLCDYLWLHILLQNYFHSIIVGISYTFIVPFTVSWLNILAFLQLFWFDTMFFIVSFNLSIHSSFTFFFFVLFFFLRFSFIFGIEPCWCYLILSFNFSWIPSFTSTPLLVS